MDWRRADDDMEYDGMMMQNDDDSEEGVWFLEEGKIYHDPLGRKNEGQNVGVNT